jgi:hypothetical protein
MRTQNRPFRLIAAVAVSGLLLAQVLPQSALAQTAPPPQASTPDQQTGDPPTRVGRLAQVTGTVSFHTQDESQWNPVSANYPIAEGNAFWTQPSAQATMQISASTIAMASETELDIATLNDTAFQGTLPQGEVYAHVQAASPNETYAVQTPRGLVTLSSGRYSVAAGDTQTPTLVTVVEGSARITGPGVELDVGANQTATITGTDTFQAQVGPAQRDPFLTAMLAREQPRPPRPQSVAPPPAVAAMPGGDQLAEYGTWSDNSQYGQVWYPQVQSGWVPYRDGHWAYVAPWGWTWVDSEPWGFAPFHYGRWSEIGGRWGWVPGAAVAGYAGPPVYAPALVTFIGFGAGVAVGAGIGASLARGNVGWFPLGPREVYRPWYRASPTYVRNVNITHVTNVTNITTINRNVTINNFANRGAATVVPASAMTASRPVSGFAQRVTPQQLAQARPVFDAQPVRPAATTAGVTPAVARQFNLQTPAPGTRPVAPGPAIHAAPAVVAPGAAVAGAAAGGHRQLPALHNPGEGATPAVVGGRPATGTPVLREPAAPGHAGPPAIPNGPNAVAPAGTAQGPNATNPGGAANPGAGTHQVPTAAPAGTAQVPPVTNPGGAANPAAVTHQPPAETHAAPAGTAQAPPVTNPGGAANPAAVTHQPPAETHAAPAGAAQAPPVVNPGNVANPALTTTHQPPIETHGAPATAAQPQAVQTPQGPGHAGPPPIHTGPTAVAPAGNAPVSPAINPGSAANPAIVTQQPPASHMPPPTIAHPAAVQPPPVVHAAPAPPVQVHAAPSPPPPVHAAPAPAPAAVHAAPPPPVHVAPPPAPAAVHVAPPPPVHVAPPPAPVAVHAAPPPAAHPAPAPVAAAAAAAAQKDQHKKPGEP